MSIHGTDRTAAVACQAAAAQSRQRAAAPKKDAPQRSGSKAEPVDSPQEQAAVQALVSSLRGDFAELGMVPPPRSYAGVTLVQPADLHAQGSSDSSDSVGTLDKLRLILVKSMLARMEGDAPSEPPSQTDVDLIA